MSANRFCACFAVLLLIQLLPAAPAAAQVDQKRAVEDWKTLDKLCQDYETTFLDETVAKKKGTGLKADWEAWKKQFQPAWENFKKRYGADENAVRETFKGIAKPQGVSMDAWQVANVAGGINVAQAEKNFAEWADGWAKDAYRIATHSPGENLEQYERRVVRAEDAVRYCRIARSWNPQLDNAELVKQAEAVIKEVTPLWKKALTELKWPGHKAEFAGPGKPEELAAAALEFLRKNPNWSKPEYDDEHTPLAACLTGKAWEVWKKAPLTEQPTQYSIDMLVAFTGKADPETVYCYHMVFYTREEAGVKPGLPLSFANSKQGARFRMLKANVPGK
jgi:hypothetical protein